jgi:hypothetical protein
MAENKITIFDRKGGGTQLVKLRHRLAKRGRRS